MTFVQWPLAVMTFLGALGAPSSYAQDKAEMGFVAAEFSPDTVHVGEETTVFLRLTTGFRAPDRMRTFLTAKHDGADIPLLNPGDDTWLALIPAQSAVGGHTLDVSVVLEDADEARQAQAAITRLDQQILNLQNRLGRETDPGRRVQLEAQLSAKQLERTNLAAALAGMRRVLAVETVPYAVEANTDLHLLSRTMARIRNRHLLIQNNDGGFDFTNPPGPIEDPTNASFSNQYGVHALPLALEYDISFQPAILPVLRKSADALKARVIDRMNRLTAPDTVLLSKFTDLTGMPQYKARGLQANGYFRDHLAAVHLLDNPNPSAAAVNAITQAALDAVTEAQRAAALRRRLVSQGRNTALRGYDFYLRFREAMAWGQRAFAKEIAAVVAADLPSVLITEDYYFMGLGGSIVLLDEFKGEVPAYAALIASARAALLAMQKPSGFFFVNVGEGLEQGRYQENAFVIEALLLTGDVEPLSRLLAHFYSAQREHGGFIDVDDYDVIQGDAEILGALTRVWHSQTGVAMDALLRSFTLKADEPRRRIVLTAPAQPLI